MLTLIIRHDRFSENENEAVESLYHDIGIPRPKSHDIEIRELKHHDIQKQRHRDSKTFFQRRKSHDLKIPKLKN